MNHWVSVVYQCRLHKQPSSKPPPNLLDLTVTSSICLRFVLMLSCHLYSLSNGQSHSHNYFQSAICRYTLFRRACCISFLSHTHSCFTSTTLYEDQRLLRCLSIAIKRWVVSAPFWRLVHLLGERNLFDFKQDTIVTKPCVHTSLWR